MNLRALEKIHLSHGKVLEKSWKIVSEKGYEPCNKSAIYQRSWYNGSYTMMAKPMKTLGLHYLMIQFLIIDIIKSWIIG